MVAIGNGSPSSRCRAFTGPAGRRVTRASWSSALQAATVGTAERSSKVTSKPFSLQAPESRIIPSESSPYSKRSSVSVKSLVPSTSATCSRTVSIAGPASLVTETRTPCGHVEPDKQ